jgi:hypothetical protein
VLYGRVLLVCFDSCPQYYTGEAVAPYPTIFVGGNHEASNYLWEVSAARGRTGFW